MEFVFETKYLKGDIVRVKHESALYPKVYKDTDYRVESINFGFIVLYDNKQNRIHVIEDMFDYEYTKRMREIKNILS